MEYNELPTTKSASTSKAQNSAAKSVFGPDSASAFDNLWKGVSVTDTDAGKKEIIHFDTRPQHLDEEKSRESQGAELNMLKRCRTTNWACL